MEKLREKLLAADYRFDPVVTRLGGEAVAALGRNSTILARRVLGDDPLAELVRLWLLHDVMPLDRISSVLGDSLSLLISEGLIGVSGDEVRALAEIRPYADDGAVDAWVCADLVPGLDGFFSPTRSDFVLGASPASATLTHIAEPKTGALALDLGTGCGVQSLHLARHFGKVIATDVNMRAIKMAKITAALAGIKLDVRHGSLFDPVAGLAFDQIVTNPPYVMSPPSQTRLTYREGGFIADDLVRRVVIDGGRALADGGSMQVLANWAVIAGQSWEERVSDWVAHSGCDGLVVLREELDMAEYIEIWLADAGLLGQTDYRRRYEQWLDYFTALKIERVGMGWFTLKRSGFDVPTISCETLAGATVGPIGPALAAYHRGVALTRESVGAYDDLLDRRWVLNDRVRQTTIGLPGAGDPESIGLQQYYGLGRRVDLDTVMAAVVGACDGELSLRQILLSVALILDADAAALTAEVLPKLVDLIRGDWFILEGG